MFPEFYLCPFFGPSEGFDFSMFIGDDWMTIELYEVDGMFV